MKTGSISSTKADIITGDSVKMSIDANSIDYLMHNLTNLYADPATAVVREYISNAYDSHVRANQGNPVLVTFDYSHSMFAVEDFGVGMSKQEIIDIYSKYGLSTKSNTNSEIGAFGLGAKSALAIADRFDITARKDGTETIAYVEKNSKGVGVVHFVSEKPTNQPNGFKISVSSTKMSRIFSEGAETRWGALYKLLTPFRENEIMFNGHPAPSLDDEPWEIVEQDGEILGWVIHTPEQVTLNISDYTHKLPDSVIQYNVGRVLYNHDSEFLVSLSRTRSPIRMIVNIPIGSVDLTPSREELMSTDKTHTAVSSALENFLVKVNESFSEKLSQHDVDTMLGMFRAVAAPYTASYPTGMERMRSYMYRGEVISLNIENQPQNIFTSRLLAKSGPSANVQYVRSPSFDGFSIFKSTNTDIVIIDRESNIINPSDPLMPETVAKEAYYYVKTKQNKAKVNARVWLINEDIISQFAPQSVIKNRVTYTVSEFINMVKDYRSEIRKAAAANRKNGVVLTASAKDDFTVPVADIDGVGEIIFRPTSVKSLIGQKVAYIDSNSRGGLHSCVPVLGWHYNNGGVKIPVAWQNQAKSLPEHLKEALRGWKLIIIPPRRLKASIDKVLPKMVLAEDLVIDYLKKWQEGATQSHVVASIIQMFPTSNRTRTLLTKTALLHKTFTKDTVFVKPATMSLMKEVVAIDSIVNDGEALWKKIGLLELWGLLDASLKTEANALERSIHDFYDAHPLLVDTLNEPSIAQMLENKTAEHLVSYINMVDATS